MAICRWAFQLTGGWLDGWWPGDSSGDNMVVSVKSVAVALLLAAPRLVKVELGRYGGERERRRQTMHATFDCTMGTFKLPHCMAIQFSHTTKAAQYYTV